MAFQAVNWSSGDKGSLERFQQMDENDVWLYNNMVKANHIDDGVNTNEGIKILAMNARIVPSTDKTAAVSPVYDTVVYWPSGYFSPSCRPIVNVTLGARTANRAWVAVRGIGGTLTTVSSNWPDANGCWIRTTVDPPPANTEYKLEGHIPLHIIAVGY